MNNPRTQEEVVSYGAACIHGWPAYAARAGASAHPRTLAAETTATLWPALLPLFKQEEAALRDELQRAVKALRRSERQRKREEVEARALRERLGT